MFTVSSSGDGWFYFSIYMSVDYGQFAHLEIEVNDDVMCTAQGDNNESGASDALLYPDSWHLYGCGLLYNIVVECDLLCMRMCKIIKS